MWFIYLINFRFFFFCFLPKSSWLIEVRYKKEITELKAKNDSLTAELQKSNKTISSYQFVQITTLKEIEELKKSLEEAKV